MKETFTVNESDLRSLAEKVISILSDKSKGVSLKIPRAKVILLEGDLGAGKTTFTKVFSEVLGINSEDVHSPTFILKKTYDTNHSFFKKLVHIDAYRFTHPNEASVLRLEDDLKNPDTIIAVEWPSKMSYIKSDIEIAFEVIDDDTREITLSYD